MHFFVQNFLLRVSHSGVVVYLILWDSVFISQDLQFTHLLLRA